MKRFGWCKESSQIVRRRSRRPGWGVIVCLIGVLAALAGICAASFRGGLYALILLSRLFHGAPIRTVTIPAHNFRAAREARRGWALPHAAGNGAPAQVNLLGALTYLAGGNAPYWGLDYPGHLLVRQSDCSLTEYSATWQNNTAQAVQSNYQDVLHQQAGLTTTGDRWPDGCADTRLGTASDFAIAQTTKSGNLYLAFTASYGPFNSNPGVTVFELNASNTAVTSMKEYSTPYTPSMLTSLDVTGDGIPDLVVLSLNSSTEEATISVFPGVGDGTFTSATDYSTTLLAEGFTLADVNNDGYPDIVVVGRPSSGNASDPFVQVFLNNGKGGFGPAINGPSLPDTVHPEISIAADFNGDGNKDIAVNDGYILLGDGTGHFTLVSGQQFPAADSLAAGDFNHDGKIDLATVDYFVNSANQNTVSIFLGNGDGTFSAGQTYASIFGGGNIGVSDLDGDGNPDIVVGLWDPHLFGPDEDTGSYEYFLMGRGDGTFAGAQSYPVLNNSISSYGPPFTIADFTADNYPDIATVGSSNGSYNLQLLDGNADGTFVNGQSSALNTLTMPDQLLSTDINGDKLPDVVIASATQQASTLSGEIAVLLGNGNGTFQPEQDTDVAFGPTAIVNGDFDNDGVMDLVAGGTASLDQDSNPMAGTLVFLKGNNNGGFQTPQQIATPLNAVSIAAADFNGDKNLDLVVADGGAPDASTPVAGNVTVYLGNGKGTFTETTTLPGPLYPQSVVVADVNNDHNQDIVVLAGPNNQKESFVSTIYAYLGEGNGQFKPPITETMDEYGDMIAAADLNGDGIADLAISSCCGFANTEVWTGKGTGAFTGPQWLPIAVSSSNLMLTDINGDNRPDLIVSNGYAIQTVLNQSPISNATIKATPDKINFGKVDATGAGKPHKVTVTTTSKNVSAVIGTISVAEPFEVVTGSDHCSGQTIAPKKTCTFSLNFTPATAGSAAGALGVPYNGSPEPQISLEGTALSVTLSGPKSENLGSAAAGSSGKALKLSISNPSTVSVTTGTAAITEGPFQISTDECSGKTLPPKGKCPISVQFAPPSGAIGKQKGQISLPYSYGSNPGTYNAALSGVVK